MYLFMPFSSTYSCPLAMTDGAARLIELSDDEYLKRTDSDDGMRHAGKRPAPWLTPNVAASRRRGKGRRRGVPAAGDARPEAVLDVGPVDDGAPRRQRRQPHGDDRRAAAYEPGRAAAWDGGAGALTAACGPPHRPNPACSADGSWKISGFKWFSSATDADITLLLARPQNADGAAPEGSRGLSLFYARVRDDQNRLNGVRIHRLKNKLGTKALPTAELELRGMTARMVRFLRGGARARAREETRSVPTEPCAPRASTLSFGARSAGRAAAWPRSRRF